MTPKQKLLAHLRLRHGRSVGSRATFAELQRWHARQHHQYATNHYHEGSNTGPNDRPAGWYTGEGVVMKNVH